MTVGNISLDRLILLYAQERLPSASMLKQLGVVMRSLRTFQPAFIGVADFDRQELLAWREWLLKDRGVTRRTWNNYLTHLKLLLNFGVEIGFLAEDQLPTIGVKLLPDYQKKKKTVSDDGLRKVVAFLESKECSLQPSWFWVLVVRTMFYTGMRRRQVVGLRWGDIDFQGGTVLLRAEWSKTKREWLIPLPKPVKTALMELKGTVGVLVGGVKADMQVFNVTLFYSRYAGSEMSEQQLSGFFRRLRERTGVEISPHKLRHTFGTKATNAKGSRSADLKVVQSLMGHTSLRTTMDYIHPDLEDGLRVMAQLEF